jgi:tetratricopeptide (TPR) repeat protein
LISKTTQIQDLEIQLEREIESKESAQRNLQATLSQVEDISQSNSRNTINTKSLASRLDTYRVQLTPEAVINSLKYNGKYQEAFSTIQDILLDNTTYDLLLLAGSIAKENLKKTLEGIDYFERAISRDPEKINAYEMQLLTILETIHEIGEKSVQELIKYKLRDFDKLPPEKQKTYEVKTARWLITQKAYKEALKFIYPRLFEGDKFLWWNFDMNIAYTEILIKLNKLNDAQKNLNEIKKCLQKVKSNKSIEPEEIKKAETQIKLFEKYISNK